MWGSQGEELAGYSDRNGEVGSSTNAFHPVDVMVGPYRVYNWASVAAVAPLVEECVQKLCSIDFLMVFVRDTTLVSWKVLTSIQIHCLPDATTMR